MCVLNPAFPGSSAEDQRLGVVLSRAGGPELPLDHGLVEELHSGSGEAWSGASYSVRY